jgi:hypothetical protein
VSSLAVVEHLDVLEDGGAEVASARPWLAVHELLLDRREEALSDCVVVTVAPGSHRHGDPGITGLLTEAESDILRSLIAVMNKPRLWPSTPHGHLQRVGDELGAQVLSIAQPTILRL